MLCVRLTIPPTTAQSVLDSIDELGKLHRSAYKETRLVEIERCGVEFAEVAITYMYEDLVTRRYEAVVKFAKGQAKFLSATWYGYDRQAIYRDDSGPLSVINGARTSSTVKTMTAYELSLLSERTQGVAHISPSMPNLPQ